MGMQACQVATIMAGQLIIGAAWHDWQVCCAVTMPVRVQAPPDMTLQP